MLAGDGTEPFISEVFGGEGEEDGVGEKLAGCQSYGLGSACVGQVLRG